MVNRGKLLTADVAIIGGGVSGASIARTLSGYKIDTVLLEKEEGVALETSRANSGIIHGGFHHNRKYLKTELELKGIPAFDQLSCELGFPFKRCGILVVALREEDLKFLLYLYEQGMENGSDGIEMCSRGRMIEMEPGLNPAVIGGLYSPLGGIIDPYLYTCALAESAMENGVQVITGFKVSSAEVQRDGFTIHADSGAAVKAEYVINAAGLYADEVSKIFGAEEYIITPRKGEYFVLDKETKNRPARVLFPVPTAVSKGSLVIPQPSGRVLVGPTAEEVNGKDDYSTSAEKLERVFDAGRQMVADLDRRDVVTAFAGNRPTLPGGDFYIDISSKIPRFIQVAGIQSPGLTASPAIGEYVKDLLEKAGCPLKAKSFSGALLNSVSVKKAPPLRQVKEVSYDVLIIGGGAGGMFSALKIEECGYSAAIVEREEDLGGVLLGCVYNGFSEDVTENKLTGPKYAENLASRVRESGVSVYLETTAEKVTGGQGGYTVLASGKFSKEFSFSAKAVVFAAGGRERSREELAISGTRPSGVITGGEALKLVDIKGDLPGKEIVVLGAGDTGLLLSRRLSLAGANVKALVEILPFHSGLPDNARECFDVLGLPPYFGHIITRIYGKDRLEKVDISPLEHGAPVMEKTFSVECDTLVICAGAFPAENRINGGPLKTNPGTGGPIVNSMMMSSARGIFVSGNALQIHGDVKTLREQAERVGLGVARYLKGDSPRKEVRLKAGGNVRYVNPERVDSKDPGPIYIKSLIGKMGSHICLSVGGETVKEVKIGNRKPFETLTLSLSKGEIDKILSERDSVIEISIR